jgi:hypothetical protein
VGGEYALSAQLVRLTGQYLYADFRQKSMPQRRSSPPRPLTSFPPSLTARRDLRTNLILVGATYRFGGAVRPLEQDRFNPRDKREDDTPSLRSRQDWKTTSAELVEAPHWG